MLKGKAGERLESYKKLFGNSVVFAVGSFGSRLISLILVPLYTYYLSTAEYGTVDLVITTVSLLLPIVSADIYTAILRFVMDKNQTEEDILTNGIVVAAVGSFTTLLLFPVLLYFKVFEGVLVYLYVILVLQVFQGVFAQFTRAIGKVKIFALNGILMTFITGAFNIVFLAGFNMGISGYLLTLVISNIFSMFFLVFTVKIYRYIQFEKVSKEIIRKMLVYSVPIIPNSIMWWLINASNRYFIFFFVGVAGNGLFAVANKMPNILSVFNQIFSQAWQMSAIEEYENDSKKAAEFYSNVFRYFSSGMLLVTSGVLAVLKIFMAFAVAPEYYEGWQSVPFLLLAVSFSSFSTFLGTNYLAAKQTKGAFKTSIYGGLSSLILNLLFVPLLGINGAGVATMSSFFVMWVIRIYDTKGFIAISIDVRRTAILLGVIFIQTVVLFLNLKTAVETIIVFGLFLLLLICNKDLLEPIVRLLFKRMKKRKR